MGIVAGPLGLLAGLIKQPMILFTHFFSVAFVSVWLLFRDTPWTHLIVFPYHSLMVLWTACVVIFPFIWTEIWS